MNNRGILLLSVAVTLLLCVTARATTWNGDFMGPIMSPVTMTEAESPHYVVSTLTIAQWGELTIEPGAVVYFASGAALRVLYGKLIADAAAGSPIVMSFYSGAGSSDYWPGIQFESSSLGDESVLRNVNMYKAGAPGGAAIWMDRNAPVIENVQIRNSAGAGILINGPITQVFALSNVMVENCLGDGIVVIGPNAAVSIQSGSIVQNNGGHGLDVRAGARPGINGVTIRDNSGYAIGLEPGAGLASLTGLTLSGNGDPSGTKNAIGYRGGTITGLETWAIYPNLPWHILSTTTVATSTGVLTIPPGQTIYFAPGAYLDVAGKVIANGTTSAPILFTSLQGAPPIVPIDAPVISATGASTAVSVAWSPPSGAISYEVHRKDSASAAWTLRHSGTTTSFSDTGVTGLRSYLYKVVAVGPGGSRSSDSNVDLATTITYTDPTLPPNFILIKAKHIVEVRKAVNAICTFAGAANCGTQPFTGTALDEPYMMTQLIKASDFTAVRALVESLRSSIGASGAVFRETVSAGALIKAIHMEDLRTGAN